MSVPGTTLLAKTGGETVENYPLNLGKRFYSPWYSTLVIAVNGNQANPFALFCRVSTQSASTYKYDMKPGRPQA